MSFKATEEQVKAVELTNEYRTLKLSALAGAAKTSTCTLVAEANPVQSLYLAFNKTMADDAQIGQSIIWSDLKKKVSDKFPADFQTVVDGGWYKQEDQLTIKKYLGISNKVAIAKKTSTDDLEF